MITLEKLKELGLTDEEAILFLQQSGGLSAQDEGGLYDAAVAIAGLSGSERDKAIAELSADYEGRKDSLRDDLTTAYDQFTSESPQGQMTADNQFGYYQAASPLEHAASGWMKYVGGKGMKDVKAERERLSGMQESAQGKVLNSMANSMQSPSSKGMTPPPGLTPEEQEKWRQMMQSRLLRGFA